MPELFIAKHRVRTYECDLYAHVNNAVYLNYLEFGRMSALEAKGFTLAKLREMGYMVVVREIRITYHHPVSEGDSLEIRTYMKSNRISSGVFHQEIYKMPENTLVVRADVTWVFTNLQGKPVPIPQAVKEGFHLNK